MQVIVDTYYEENCAECETPEGQPVTRVGEGGVWEVLDAGVWTPPSGAYAVPALPDIIAPTPEERRCLAALNAELVLHQLYEEWTDAWGAELSLFDAIVTIAEWLTTRIGVWLGLLSGGQALIVFAIAEVFYDVLESVTADYWDAEFSDKMKCLLLYHAGNVGDGVVFDFVAFREDLVLQTNWLDPTLNDIRLMMQIQYMLQFIGGEGLNHAGATTSITEPDCDMCLPTWCYEWDFTVALGNWELYPGIVGSVGAGGFETGLAYVGGDPSRGRRFTIINFPSFPADAIVNRIESNWNNTLGNVSASSGLGIYVDNLVTNIVPEEAPTNGLVAAVFEGSGTGWTSVQVINAVGGCDGCGDPGGVGYGYKLRMNGTGELPGEFFGGYEC